jgi:hypothetical protein
LITACIDPGEHRSAVAVFDGPELVSLEWIKPGEVWPGLDLVDRIVIEKPRLYPRHPRPGNILNLGWGGALVAGAFRPNLVIAAPDARCDVKLPKGTRALIVYEPVQWKGGVKKPPHHLRCWEVLGPHERALFNALRNARGKVSRISVEARIRAAVAKLAKSRKVKGYSFEAHNLLDAMALGLFFLKRTEKGGAVRGRKPRRPFRSFPHAA